VRALEILKSLEALRDKKDARVFPISANALKSAFERARAKANAHHFGMHLGVSRSATSISTKAIILAANRVAAEIALLVVPSTSATQRSAAE